MSDYNIRNTDQTLSQSLIQQAKSFANNAVKQQGRSVTDSEVNLLLQTALNNDNTISEEEVKFIAGLTVENNVKSLNENNFSPVNQEIKFSKVSEPRLNQVRKLAHTLASSRGAMSPVEKVLKADPRLSRFFNELNNPTLTPEARRTLVEEYRTLSGKNFNHYKTIADEDFFSSGVFHKAGLSFNDRGGMFEYFINQSRETPFKEIMTDMVKSFKTLQFKSPQQALDVAMGIALRHKVDDPKRYALMALAALSTELHNGSFPDDQTHFKEDLKAAYIRFNNYDEKSGSQVLMSHNVVSRQNDGRADFSEDNGFHFWSHAFITYEMLSRGENGNKYDENEARSFSAFVGAEYELSSPWENLGNAAIKDVIMNAYGAEFGILMYKTKGVVQLPKLHEGPQIEDRTHKMETGNTAS